MSTVITPVGFLFFPNLFDPRPPAQGQDPRFSCILLFDDEATKSTAYQNLRAAVQAAAADKFGAAKAADAAFMRSLRLPFRQASEKEYDGFDQGTVWISAWTKGDGTPPGVVDLKGQAIKVPGDVFSGQLARATVRAWGYDTSGNKGISFGLEHVQIVKQDMPRFDGRQSADKAFAGAAIDPAEMARLGIDPNAADTSTNAAAGGMPW